jgi:hypothetical protein
MHHVLFPVVTLAGAGDTIPYNLHEMNSEWTQKSVTVHDCGPPDYRTPSQVKAGHNSLWGPVLGEEYQGTSHSQQKQQLGKHRKCQWHNKSSTEVSMRSNWSSVEPLCPEAQTDGASPPVSPKFGNMTVSRNWQIRRTETQVIVRGICAILSL